MENIKENKMGVMPVRKLLITMSLPMVISMFVQAMYNLIDSIFVAQIDQNALTAVNMAFPMQSLMIAFQTGLGVGMNALISRLLGEKKPRDAGNAAIHGLILTLVNYLLFLTVGLTLTTGFFTVQSKSTAVISYGVDYLSIICPFSFGLFFQICFERFLQATGKTVHSMIMQGTGAVINLIFDPILIFGIEPLGIPAMGVKGAAIATVAGQMVSMLIGIILHFGFNKELKLNFREFRLSWKSIGKIYSVGVPSIIMSGLLSVMTYLMNIILKGYEETAATAFGVYFKLQSFVIMPVFGMNNGIVPIIAYNYGAMHRTINDKTENDNSSYYSSRITKTVKLGIIFASCTMLIGLLLFQIFPTFFLSFFNPDDKLLDIGTTALRTLSWSFLFVGEAVVLTSELQALGHGVMSLFVFLVRLLVPALPLAWLFGKLWGLNAIWWALPVSDLLGLILAVIFVVNVNRKVLRR